MVLIALADKADNDGVCWPNLATLAEMTCMAESTVSEHISALVSDGYVERRRRRQQSAVCTVVRDRLEGQDFPDQEILIQEVKAQGFPNQEVSTDQDFLIPPLKTSGSGKSLKRTPNEPPISSAKPAAGEDNPDASKLCDRLVELMVGNGCKPPTITSKWLTSARLLLTKDGRAFPEALAVLEWCQADDFEMANIHSLPKFRARYDQLRQKAQRAGALTAKATAPTTAEGVAEWLRQQWQKSAVSAIEQATGIRYEQPDLPLDVDVNGADEFYRNHRREWITAHHGDIITALTGRAA